MPRDMKTRMVEEFNPDEHEAAEYEEEHEYDAEQGEETATADLVVKKKSKRSAKTTFRTGASSANIFEADENDETEFDRMPVKQRMIGVFVVTFLLTFLPMSIMLYLQKESRPGSKKNLINGFENDIKVIQKKHNDIMSHLKSDLHMAKAAAAKASQKQGGTKGRKF